ADSSARPRHALTMPVKASRRNGWSRGMYFQMSTASSHICIREKYSPIAVISRLRSKASMGRVTIFIHLIPKRRASSNRLSASKTSIENKISAAVQGRRRLRKLEASCHSPFDAYINNMSDLAFCLDRRDCRSYAARIFVSHLVKFE